MDKGQKGYAAEQTCRAMWYMWSTARDGHHNVKIQDCYIWDPIISHAPAECDTDMKNISVAILEVNRVTDTAHGFSTT